MSFVSTYVFKSFHLYESIQLLMVNLVTNIALGFTSCYISHSILTLSCILHRKWWQCFKQYICISNRLILNRLIATVYVVLYCTYCCSMNLTDFVTNPFACLHKIMYGRITTLSNCMASNYNYLHNSYMTDKMATILGKQ